MARPAAAGTGELYAMVGFTCDFAWWRPHADADHHRVSTRWERQARQGLGRRCPVVFLDVDGVR